MNVFVDYTILHECQYPVLDSGSPELESDCGKPAPFSIYWTFEDGASAGEMIVCEEHFKFIMDREKEPKEG